jgi:hypothetical protein
MQKELTLLQVVMSLMLKGWERRQAEVPRTPKAALQLHQVTRLMRKDIFQ